MSPSHPQASSSSSLAPHQATLIPMGSRTPAGFITWLLVNILAALKRLDLTLNPAKTFAKVRRHRWSLRSDYPYLIMGTIASIMLYLMESPAFPYKLGIPIGYAILTTVPFLSQFFWPGTPVLCWVITFFSARYVPTAWRPEVHVALLPTLESVLYGANISDILTRYTHPALDVLAWLPYGVIHFVIPFVVAAVAFVFGPRGSINYWGKVFGYMNLTGVLIQIVFPCSAPWYELIHGLTPATYSMAGSAGGLSRIDKIFGGNGYTETFSTAPLVFGAFPSLHSGCATLEALFLSHFFPRFRIAYWVYCCTLYWSTMYLTHHYLIDVVGGGCLATFFFYYLMPAELREWETGGVGRFDEYNLVDNPQSTAHDENADLDEEIRKLEEGELDTTADDDAPSSSTSKSHPPPSSSIMSPKSRPTSPPTLGKSLSAGGSLSRPSSRGPDGETSARKVE